MTQITGQSVFDKRKESDVEYDHVRVPFPHMETFLVRRCLRNRPVGLSVSRWCLYCSFVETSNFKDFNTLNLNSMGKVQLSAFVIHK